MKVIERRLLSFKQKIDMIRSNTFFFINPLEWSILTETEESTTTITQYPSQTRWNS